MDQIVWPVSLSVARPTPSATSVASGGVDMLGAGEYADMTPANPADQLGVVAEFARREGCRRLGMLAESLGVAATLLVHLIMVATFRSLLKPLILVVSIPFAATGAIVALVVTNTTATPAAQPPGD